MTVLLLLSVLLSTYLIAANQNKENIVIYNREAVVTALLYNAFLCWLYAEGASLFDVINSHTASNIGALLCWFKHSYGSVSEIKFHSKTR